MPVSRRLSVLVAAIAVLATAGAHAQQPPPPAVGVVRAEKKSVTQSSEFVGRIQAVERVNLVARVTAFLNQRLFVEGSEVKTGDPLFRLERTPFEADVRAKEAAVAQMRAQLQNANVTLERARALLSTPAGQRSTYDTALANQKALEAQVLAAQAQLDQSKIDLGYTEIRAPIDGKIGRATVTVGNVVMPSSGTLATIVSQDPMYVMFPVSVRTALELRDRYAGKGGFDAVEVWIKQPNGRTFDRPGRIDFVDNTVSGSTDTLMLRGVVPNPPLQQASGLVRPLVDGEFVTVVFQDTQPVQALSIPRAAVLSDQAGDYVFVVDGQNTAHQKRVQLGQASTPTSAFVTSGLEDDALVIVEGLQRVRSGQPVLPGPASTVPPSGTAARPPADKS